MVEFVRLVLVLLEVVEDFCIGVEVTHSLVRMSVVV